MSDRARIIVCLFVIKMCDADGTPEDNFWWKFRESRNSFWTVVQESQQLWNLTLWF